MAASASDEWIIDVADEECASFVDSIAKTGDTLFEKRVEDAEQKLREVTGYTTTMNSVKYTYVKIEFKRQKTEETICSINGRFEEVQGVRTKIYGQFLKTKLLEDEKFVEEIERIQKEEEETKKEATTGPVLQNAFPDNAGQIMLVGEFSKVCDGFFKSSPIAVDFEGYENSHEVPKMVSMANRDGRVVSLLLHGKQEIYESFFELLKFEGNGAKFISWGGDESRIFGNKGLVCEDIQGNSNMSLIDAYNSLDEVKRYQKDKEALEFWINYTTCFDCPLNLNLEQRRDALRGKDPVLLCEADVSALMQIYKSRGSNDAD